MDESEVRRRPTLSHQLSRVASSNLRDFLKVRDDESSSSSRPVAATRTMSSRTLLDVIKDEDDPQRLMPGHGGNRVSWKAFKDRLKLRRATSVWSMSSSSDDMAVAPGSPRPVSILESSRAFSVPNLSTSMQSTSESQAGGEENADAAPVTDASERTEQTEGPTRVSLMALLEHEERSGPSFAASVMGLVEEEEEEDASEHSREAAAMEGKEMHVCCVCMVRHKGAAFIPCGHTFCRLCSRELWISRGICPLCNGFIHEILDIF